MMPNKLKKLIALFCYFSGVTFLSFGVWYLIFSNNKLTETRISNVNLEKNVTREELLSNQSSLSRQELTPVYYDDVLEAIENAKYFPTSFKGKLTHYGPDCPLCGGRLGCNLQDARNGNIYYDDKEYGTVRIVATTKKIPCGSIIRINVDAYDPNGMYAIVLDRGVSPGIIDLLKVSQTTPSPVRTTNNVIFDIVRYGY